MYVHKYHPALYRHNSAKVEFYTDTCVLYRHSYGMDKQTNERTNNGIYTDRKIYRYMRISRSLRRRDAECIVTLIATGAILVISAVYTRKKKNYSKDRAGKGAIVRVSFHGARERNFQKKGCESVVERDLSTREATLATQ